MRNIFLCLLSLLVTSYSAEVLTKTIPVHSDQSVWSTKILLHPDCDMKSVNVQFEKRISVTESIGVVKRTTPQGAINGELQESSIRSGLSKRWRTGQLGRYKLLDIYCQGHMYTTVTISYELQKPKRESVKYRAYHYDQIRENVTNPEMFTLYENRFSRRREKETLAILIPEKVRVTLDSLDAFIALKEQVGFNVLLVTDDEWGGGIGDMAAENIRLWIEDSYEEKGLDYILFIGYPHTDKGEVPMKMTWPQYQLEKYREAPTDFYFAELTGNWDVDGDGNYGEFEDDFMQAGGPDQYAELNIGRIPVFSKTKTDHILNKMIRYESEKFADAMAWRKNVLLPMNNMNAEDDPNFTPGIRLAEAIKYDILEPASFKSFRIFDDNYDGFGLQTPAELTPCTYATVKETWNSQDFGLVVWQAHGFAQHATDVMSVSFSKVLNDEKVPFVFSTSCHNGSTNTDNLSMYLLQNGAINMVSATRVEYWSPGQDGFWDEWPSGGSMAYGYTKNLIEDSLPSSVALNRVKADIQTEMLELNSMWWMNWLVYHVYGDPTQGIYSSIDKGTVVKYPPVLTPFDTLGLSKESPTIELTLLDKVSDKDHEFEELRWEIESSELFTVTLEGATLATAVNNTAENCCDTVALTVSDPDEQSDSVELVIVYNGGTSLEDAVALSENSGLFLCDNPISVGGTPRYVVTDENMESMKVTLFDHTGSELFTSQVPHKAAEIPYEIPFRAPASGALCILFTCHYESGTRFYKAILGVKK